MAIDGSVLQRMIDASMLGDWVVVPAGTYMVDAVNAPITVKGGITLDLSGVTLAAIANNQIFSIIIKIEGVQNVTIVGGLIKGERLTHDGPTAAAIGGGGGAIAIGRSSHVNIRGVRIEDSFCDGLLVWHADTVEIDRVISNHNRRQGMSIVDSHDVYVHDSQFTNNGGTPPGDGIDIENDLETENCINIVVERCVFAGNAGSGIGVGSPGLYHNIRLAATNSFDGKTQPIWVAGNAGSLGTSWWAFILNRIYGKFPGYAWWGYPRSWYRA